MSSVFTDAWSVVLSLADGSTGVDLSVFAQYGVLGVLTVLLIWFAKGAHQRERDRADRLEAENQRLNQVILDRVIPALTSASRAAEDSSELMRDMQREREVSTLAHKRITDRLTARLGDRPDGSGRDE